VIDRVPILRKDDVLEEWPHAMNRLNHLIALGHRKRAAGAEVVLHIDDNQNVSCLDPHRSPLQTGKL
jgi:hypothetical protein